MRSQVCEANATLCSQQPGGCWIGTRGWQSLPSPPGRCLQLHPFCSCLEVDCSRDPNPWETKPTSVNYYKHPLEYKNSISLVFAFSLSPDKGMAERKRSWYLSGKEARLHNGPGGGSLAWGSCEGKVLWRESAEPAGRWVLGGKEPPTQSLLRLFAWTSGRLRLISILFSRLSRGWRTLKQSEVLLLPSHQHPKCQVPGKIGLENGGSRQCDCSCSSFSLGVDTDGGKT